LTYCIEGGTEMAWKEVNKMEQRRSFIRDLESGYVNFSELCREYGISRVTGYKWYQRYTESGLSGLKDRSSCPTKYREQVSSDIVIDLINLRNEHPTWGGRTLRNFLVSQKYPQPLPCSRTIDRILKRAGLVSSKSSYKRQIYQQAKIVKPSAPNQVWTVDFKGWWNTLDGKRCEPLTIRDEYSRFILSIEALAGTKQIPVKEAFIACFEKYGLPDYIRSDNGNPFSCSRSIHGLTKLSAWWIKLGITPNRIPPSSPQYNGGHERMHKDIKQELQVYPAANLKKEQQRFDSWRYEFNHIRPHQSLQDKTPSTIYKASRRKYTEANDYVYNSGFEYRKVCDDGQVFWKNKRVLITKALYGEYVGIDVIDKNISKVWYRDFYLGFIDLNNYRKIIPEMIISG
jgi:transposase InsO family protein